MAVLKNRAKMSTSTTGTGTITLGSAEDGYQTFADAGVADADVVRYVIEDGSNFEIGTGTYTATGTTLTRTVSESSNSDAAINLSGSATVFIGATAEDILSDVVDDTTPQLGGNLDVQAREITTSTTNGNVKLTPNGTGVVEVKGAGGNDGTLQLNCSANSHGVKIKSPPHSAAASYTLTLPDDDGGASEFLQTDGSGNLSWATAGGGGADLYAANESSPTAQPSATGTNSIGIGDSAVSSGARSVSLSNSRASGDDSFAAAMMSNSSSYGAQGTNSIAMGQNAKAHGYGGVALGFNATAGNGNRGYAIGAYSQATNNYSLAFGNTAVATGYGAIAFGYATSDADYAVTIGQNAQANGIKGAIVFSNGNIHSGNTDCQTGIYLLKGKTTDATPLVLTTNDTSAGSDDQLILVNNSAYAFHGTIVARQSASQGTACAAWRVEGLIRREANAGTTVLVNSATTVIDNTPSWGMALSADTTNGCLKVQVTGAASTNINYVATIHTSETYYT